MGFHELGGTFNFEVSLWDNGQVEVGLPHQCGSWEITRYDESDTPEGAIARLDLFIKEAQEARAKLVSLLTAEYLAGVEEKRKEREARAEEAAEVARLYDANEAAARATRAWAANLDG